MVKVTKIIDIVPSKGTNAGISCKQILFEGQNNGMQTNSKQANFAKVQGVKINRCTAILTEEQFNANPVVVGQEYPDLHIGFSKQTLRDGDTRTPLNDERGEYVLGTFLCFEADYVDDRREVVAPTSVIRKAIDMA